VTLWHGSSDELLATFAPRLHQPSVIYLDAHSIEDNPLLRELQALQLSPCKSHVLLIDDVRMFGTPDWHGLPKADAIACVELINLNYSVRYVDTAHGVGDLMVCEVL
jgi:hypothetical protein